MASTHYNDTDDQSFPFVSQFFIFMVGLIRKCRSSRQPLFFSVLHTGTPGSNKAVFPVVLARLLAL